MYRLHKLIHLSALPRLNHCQALLLSVLPPCPPGKMSTPFFTATSSLCTALLICNAACCGAQSIAVPWSGYGHDAQHTGISSVAAQPMNAWRWQTPVDEHPQYSGSTLYIHYGSPIATRANTIIFPVKTGDYDGFRLEARNGANGSVTWTQASDYTLPAHGWVPSFNAALTPKNRLWYPGAGGSVYFRDTPDAATGTSEQITFYGMGNLNPAVKISTPLTTDRYGNVFFGFVVEGTVTLPGDVPLLSGIARVAEDGTCSWRSASFAAGGAAGIVKVVGNCAPALSNDHRTLYFAVSMGSDSGGYVVSLDSRTLAPIAKIQLKDPHLTGYDASLPDDGTASPTVGPDGDVYFGVLEASRGSNHYRGWMLHFDAALSQVKIPGAFGWDDTASIVPSSAVPAYTGTSKYLLLTKYNNYAGVGGNGLNKVAVLDPNDTMADPITGVSVMKEILTALGPTPDAEYPTFPGAVREWCINTAAVDPIGKCAIVNSEDGKVYRWDFTTNALIQTVTLTPGIGEAYTPTIIGVDGRIYAISNAILFCVGQ